MKSVERSVDKEHRLNKSIWISIAALFATVLALASVALASSGAAAQEGIGETPNVSREGAWIVFSQERGYALRNATMYVKQGARLSDGNCKFSGELVLRPGQQAIEERQVALNPSNCQARMERGTPPNNTGITTTRSVSDYVTDGVVQESDFRGSQDASNADTSRTLASTTRSRGFYKTWWEDPVNLDVNSVQNSTDWRWNGTRVSGPVYGGYDQYWLGASGWRRLSNDWNNYYTSYQTTSSSKVHFRNGIFCEVITGTFGSPTHAYYDRNKVRGRYNGDLVGDPGTWVTGGCTGLLSFNQQLRRTLN